MFIASVAFLFAIVTFGYGLAVERYQIWPFDMIHGYLESCTEHSYRIEIVGYLTAIELLRGNRRKPVTSFLGSLKVPVFRQIRK